MQLTGSASGDCRNSYESLFQPAHERVVCGAARGQAAKTSRRHLWLSAVRRAPRCEQRSAASQAARRARERGTATAMLCSAAALLVCVLCAASLSPTVDAQLPDGFKMMGGKVRVLLRHVLPSPAPLGARRTQHRWARAAAAHSRSA